MTQSTPSARLRRGAWEGSRAAAAITAALAAILLAATAPPAAAFPCEDGRPRTPGAWTPSPPPGGECRAPESVTRADPPKRKKGSISAFTVFVLAIGGVLLIPIGGAIGRGDPFGHDRGFYERKSSTT